MTCKEKVTSGECRELLLDYRIAGTYMEGDPGNDYCQVMVDEDISILYFVPYPNAPVDIGNYPYYSLPKCYGLMQEGFAGGAGESFDPLPLLDAGILQAQGPPLFLTGRGVILGFVDTGIRYTQEVFRDSAGNSRILAIWDQTIEGAAPDGFLYGTEYIRADINEALRTGMPRQLLPSWDEDGHGTALASVAAGSVLEDGNRFQGAAPGADIAVVKLRGAKPYLREYYGISDETPAYAETDIILAVKYLEQIASARQQPLVICLGIGTNYGGHTGASILDRYLDRIGAKRNRTLVVCGGNEGASGHHFQSASGNGPETVELRVDEGEGAFLMEVWTEGPGRYTLSVQTPGGERIADIAGRGRPTQEYRFVLDRSVIAVNSISPEESSGGSLVLMRFQNPTPGIWRFVIDVREAAISGRLNFWLPIDAFLRGGTVFLRSDPEITLTAPSLTQNVITITAYNDADGGFYERSGRGFTADRRMKPDFAAPGVHISTSLGQRTGSSYAAALAAGGAAQMLQWAVTEQNYPLASSREVKYYLALGAARSSQLLYPNREWGLGRINIQRTFQELAGLF